MKGKIPDFVKPFLWSYDTKSLDLQASKRRIITNLLNLGTGEATDWLFSAYPKEDIVAAIRHPLPGEWNERSLRLWSLVLDVTPGNAERLLPVESGQ